MKTMFRSLIIFAISLSAAGVSAQTAFAAAPSNDTFANAVTVSALPFSDSVDTTQATTDADDAQLNSSCGAPATDASVWYTLQGTDSPVVVDVSASNYSAGVLVGTGAQGSLSIVACGPGAVSFYAAAGTTYYILAIDDQTNGDGLNGGTLNLSMSEILSPTLDSFTVNRNGTASSKTGVATISGTYSCRHGDFIDVAVNASQLVGRFKITGAGEFIDFNTCDGTTHAWKALVYPQNGKFAGGKAMTVSTAYTCGASECAFGYAEKTVMLRSTK
jgi:hypothetical protein